MPDRTGQHSDYIRSHTNEILLDECKLVMQVKVWSEVSSFCYGAWFEFFLFLRCISEDIFIYNEFVLFALSA